MSQHDLTLSELDELVEAFGFPVRETTLTEAWDRIETPGSASLFGGQVLLVVSMLARPSRETRFEAAAREFVDSTLAAAGTGSSMLHRSQQDPLRWFLVERFASRTAFERHMASDYFRRFQVEQQSLLAEPVQALFLQ